MLLLITGCINVDSNTPYVSVRASEERLKQYLTTLQWAIEETDFETVVFCENSNYQYDFYGFVSGLSRGKEKNFEYLTFQGDVDGCIRQGKGYGEGEIVKYAYNHSQYMSKEKAFYKITGKLIVDNINELLSFDSQSRFMNQMDRIRKVDTKFYKLNMMDYVNSIQEAYLDVHDSENMILERVYYDCLHKNKVRYVCFCRVPVITGISGSSGKAHKRISPRREKLYNAACRLNIYNWRIIAYIDYFFNKIGF